MGMVTSGLYLRSAKNINFERVLPERPGDIDQIQGGSRIVPGNCRPIKPHLINRKLCSGVLWPTSDPRTKLSLNLLAESVSNAPLPKEIINRQIASMV